MYAEMLARLSPRKNQTHQEARRSLDLMLSVSSWALPGREASAAIEREPGAPWWWHGAEEASDSFLKSMGVSL